MWNTPESCPQQFPLLYIALSYCCFNLTIGEPGSVTAPDDDSTSRLNL
jgi:hypothetical protein